MRAKLIKEYSGGIAGMGAGFSMMRGGGFGGANNIGGPNMMYTYEIKPLNRMFQQKDNPVQDFEEIHLGMTIVGKKIGKELDKKNYTGSLIKIIKDDKNEEVKYYIILDEASGTFIKLNPTTVVIPPRTDSRSDLKLRDIHDDKPRMQGSVRDHRPPGKVGEGLVAESIDEFINREIS